jgi:hypothetical protein
VFSVRSPSRSPFARGSVASRYVKAPAAPASSPSTYRDRPELIASSRRSASAAGRHAKHRLLIVTVTHLRPTAARIAGD